MKRVYLVTATKAKTEEEFQKRPIYKSLKKLYDLYTRDQFDFTVIKDNKEGLSTVYNRFLSEEYKDDIVLFVHDDVIINCMFLVEHLNKSPFAVTGLAGTKRYNKNVEKCAWHLMSVHPSDLVGEVAHINNGDIFTTRFGGPIPSQCKLVDGVFIAVNVEEVLKTSARFQEAFNFHFYDIAFCLECEKANLSVGVMPIPIIHYGLGDSMLTQDWEDTNKKFKEVYCI